MTSRGGDIDYVRGWWATNVELNRELQRVEVLATPVKRYIAHITQTFEIAQSENTTLWAELLSTRKKRKGGKRVALEGRVGFSVAEVSEIACKADIETAAKKAKKKD